MAYKPLRAGELRHRVTIQQPGAPVQDADSGEVTRAWVDFLVDEPASVEPVSVRDYIASQAMQSTIVARIKIRWRTGLNSRMRILHNGAIYLAQGWLPDPDSGREYVTAACSLSED